MQALLKAFTSACQSSSPSKVVIPKGEFKLGEIEMRGPCKAPIEVTLQGTVKADGNAIQGKEKWVVFGNIDGFKLNGGGAFDGEGNAAWRVNNCHKTFECKKLPIVCASFFNPLGHVEKQLSDVICSVFTEYKV